MRDSEQPRVTSPWRRWRRRFLAVVLVLGTLYLTRSWTLGAAGLFLNVSEAPRPVDAVLVLGGGVDTRPFVAAALVKKGLAKRVLLPSVKPTQDAVDGTHPDEVTITRKVLLARGVPEECITVLPGEVNSTEDEANVLNRILQSQPGITVAVVTSDFHTRRARGIFRAVLGARIKQVHFVAAPTDGFGSSDWWQCEEGTCTYLNEYAKLIVYTLKQ